MWRLATEQSSPLHIDQVSLYHLLRLIMDTVHPPDPFHLIGGFQFFGDTLCLCHLLDHPIQHFTGLFVNVSQVAVQLAGCERVDVEEGFMLL